eukprot:jgi/Phyca11/96717/e_gw1.1.820.1
MFAGIAVPVGAVSLDEITVPTIARSGAKTFRSLKSDKYGVRFYGVVGWESLYAYSVWDNGSGNRTRKFPWRYFQRFEHAVPVERYVGVFVELRTPIFRTLSQPDTSVKRKDTSAWWVEMCDIRHFQLQAVGAYLCAIISTQDAAWLRPYLLLRTAR